MSEKDIKKLWELAARICSFPGCGADCILFLNSGDPTLLEEMAHVIAREPSGPRGQPDGHPGGAVRDRLAPVQQQRPHDPVVAGDGSAGVHGAPQIERNFARLKDRPLGLRPLYVQREDLVRGLARLASLALRVLTLTEHVVREQLQQQKTALVGLYAGNPKRETAHPTTERLLWAFRGNIRWSGV